MPKGVYERRTKPLTTTPAGAEDGEEGEIVLSPVPRARPKPEDDRAAWNVAMREKAKLVYQRMKTGEAISIAPDTIDVVQWMRAHGVRIKAHVQGGTTVYELVDIAVPGTSDAAAREAAGG